jgi:hypothetical protein
LANKLVSYVRRKLNIKPRKPIEMPPAPELASAPFIGADGLGYEVFFDEIHRRYLFDWYMEIGCRTGDVFSQARGKTIAVDPYFLVTRNVIIGKPELHIFQTTSDDFFASNFLAQNKIVVSVSFLDGMHLFEYLLRDFINTERISHPDGLIVMHDCCPRNSAMTTRDLDNLPTRSWTGDVWKLLPILQQYRPDLKVTVLNCSFTGLVLVSGLNPQSGVLAKNYDAILDSYMNVDLETFGAERFYSSFEYTDAQAFLDSGATPFARIALDPGRALNPVKITP